MNFKYFSNILLTTILISCGGGGGGGSSISDPVITINPIINTFLSSSNSITVGGSVELTWTTNNTIGCSAGGDWTGDKEQSDSETLTLSEIKTMSMR